ncbi:MAG TPA: amino acid adenylation domain-containing protein, partial [Longimicrobium sp.]|nr:amino acid adenylation domain-containing protein [Longimicrobium sp.]
SFQNFPVAVGGEPGESGLAVADPWGIEEANYPIALAAELRGGELKLDVAFPRARFTDEAMERMLGHLACVLDAFAADPSARLADVAIVPAAERDAVLAAGAGRAEAYPRDTTVHAVIAQRAAAWANAPASVCGGETLTFAELEERAGRLAGVLRALGVGAEVPVALFLDRSNELAVAVLAVLKAGGFYVPVDPAYPAERIAFLLDDSAAPVILTRGALAGGLPPHAAAVLHVDAVDASNEAVGGAEVDAEALAYAIYTSGSTGRPKAAMISHRSLLCYATAMAGELGLRAGDRMLQAASPSFDVMVEEIFPAWLAGAAVVFPERDVLGSPADLVEVIESAGVTGLEVPTAFWHEWVRETAQEGTRLPASLRFVIVGGERVIPDRLREWAALGVPLVHVFGLTETSVTTTTLHVAAGDDASARWSNLPIGRPIANTRVYVLDAALQPVPAGVYGELYIGGDGVARGYRGRAALTAERYFPDPLAGTPGARLYRTGDRVRWLEDGTIDFLGRTDHQVKIRGFRIEPAEVEAALIALPAVAEAAVVAREDEPGRRRLVAYLVASNGTAPGAAELRAALHGRLPEHMIPSAFVVLPQLPVTPNGKVDRKALPAPEGAAEASSTPYVAPRTETEQTLAGIWAEVLRAERIGVHDNYFELGGDSILSIQIVSRARRAGVALSPRHLFEHPTVAALARVARGGAEPAAAPEQGAVTGDAPLLPIQQWFFAQEVEAPHHWNMPLLLAPRDRLDPRALEAAFAALAAHHDALRLRFHRADGAWTQTHGAPAGAAPLETIDLSALAPADRLEALEAAAANVQSSLALGDGPLLRAALFDLGDEQRLLVAVHHLVMDGVSWRVLLEDLEAAYGRAARGEALHLPEKTTSYQAWARRLAAHTAAGGFDGEIAYWTAPTRAQAAPVPVDLDGANTEGSVDTLSVSFTTDETRALLHDVPAAWRAQAGDALVAALARALGGWSGSGAVLVDVEGHGREDLFADVDLSRTVGWFTSLYPVLLDVRGAGDDAAALRLVKEQLRAIPTRGLGHGALRWLHPDAALRARLAELPAAQVRFEYLGQMDGAVSGDAFFQLAEEAAGASADPRAPRSHLLEVAASVMDGRLEVAWTYSAAVHRRETVEALAARYAQALRGTLAAARAAGAGGATASDFPLARLDAAGFDAVIGIRRDVEDVYPLSPLQEGMLFDTLYAPGAGVYVAQFGFDLEGPLDVDAFRRAWQGVTERHPALRAGFAWEGVKTPLQVVRRRIDIPLVQEDWSALGDEERAAKLEAYLAADREAGFDPAHPPLLRLALFRTGPDAHRLVWSVHQMVVDGWSITVVFKEVAALYDAFVKGTRPALEEPRSPRDFAEWLQRQDPARLEAFWRGELAGFTAPVRLGIDAGAPPVPRGVVDWGKREGEIPAAATAALQAFARRHGLTVNTLVQGAWALLLSRYAGTDDVVFGTTVSGRPTELGDVDQMVGLFINRLAVRVAVPAGETVLPWLKSLQARQVAMRDHGHAPLVQVQRWSEVAAGRPLFECALVFENYPMGDDAGVLGHGLRIRGGFTAEQGVDPLVAIVFPGDALTVWVKHDRGRFADAAVDRLIGHLRTLLAALVAAPGARLAELPLLSEAEREAVTGGWNRTAEPADPAPVHRLFEQRARETPARAALVHAGESLTYAQANARANQLARRLRALGVGPDARVALFLERGADGIVALLAAMKAGGAYLALDAGAPGERLAMLLADAAPRAIVTRGGLIDRLPRHDIPLVSLDGDAEAIAAESGEDLGIETAPESLAYVIHTSGSTGTPKGVGIEHRQLAHYVHAVARRLDLPADGVYATVSTLAADLGNTVVFPALALGGTLHVLGDEAIQDPAAMAAAFARHPADVLKITPSHLAALLASAPAEQILPRRALVLGGEASRSEWAAGLAAHVPGLRVFNHYGPTETTVGVLAFPVETAAGLPETLPLGAPLPNARVYVLDANGLPLPAGVPGELYAGGGGVARGYLGRAALTAERFLPDPFSPVAGARMYRTGDRARRADDGTVEFLGRVDDQVKIRGYRVEPGEVAAVLQSHPAVEQAYVAARADESGEPRLVAWVVPDAHAAAPARRLMAMQAGEAADLATTELPDGATVFHLNAPETDFLYNEIFREQNYLRHGITIGAGAT